MAVEQSFDYVARAMNEKKVLHFTYSLHIVAEFYRFSSIFAVKRGR